MGLQHLNYRIVPQKPMPPWIFFTLFCAFWIAVIIFLNTCAVKVCVAKCTCPLLATATCVVDVTGSAGECSCALPPVAPPPPVAVPPSSRDEI